MTDTARLSIKADSNQVQTATQNLRRLEQQGGRTERATDGITSSFVGLRGAIAGLGIGVATTQLASYADEWTNLNNRLKLVTNTNAELVRAQTDVFNIAQATRGQLTATAELYTRLSQNAAEYITSQEDLANITTTVNQAVAVSGASAESARAAIIQLSQGFAAGVLRGEEFNSVIEQTPRLATAIADGLGVARGELRALANDGQLTSERVIRAIRSQADVINGEFATATSTIGQAWTNLNNVLIRATGNIDEATGASETATGAILAFANAIDELTGDAQVLGETLDNVVTVATLLAGLFAGRLAASLVASVTSSTAYAAALRAVSLATTGATVQTNIYGQVLARTTAASAAATAAAGGLRAALAFIGGPVGVAVLAATALFAYSQRAERAERRTQALATDVDALTVSFRNLTRAQRAQRIEALNAELQTLRATAIQLKAAIDETNNSAGNFGGAGNIGRVAQLRQQYAELQKRIEVVSAEQQGLFNVGLPDQEEFKNALDTTNDSIKTLGDVSTETSAKLRNTVLEAQLAAARARQQEFEDLRQSLRTEEEVLADSYERRYNLILENTRFFGAAQTDLLNRLNRQFATDVLEGFGSPSQSEDTIDNELARIQEQFEARRELILENTRLTEEQRTELELELTRRRNEQVEELESQRANLLLTSSRGIFSGLLSIASNYADESSALYRTLFAASKAFAIADATVKGVQAVQKAWAEVPYPANFAAAAQAGVTAAANVATIIGTNFAGAFDNGGRIGAGEFGLVGEFGPELVEGPVTVRSRRETADAFRSAQSEEGNMQQQQTGGINIVNLVDPSVVDDYLSSDEGSETILNTIRNNPEVIRAVSNS